MGDPIKITGILGLMNGTGQVVDSFLRVHKVRATSRVILWAIGE
jgi:hypothetical protein